MDSNPRRSDHESPPITTIPGPPYWFSQTLLELNKCTEGSLPKESDLFSYLMFTIRTNDFQIKEDRDEKTVFQKKLLPVYYSTPSTQSKHDLEPGLGM